MVGCWQVGKPRYALIKPRMMFWAATCCHCRSQSMPGGNINRSCGTVWFHSWRGRSRRRRRALASVYTIDSNQSDFCRLCFNVYLTFFSLGGVSQLKSIKLKTTYSDNWFVASIKAFLTAFSLSLAENSNNKKTDNKDQYKSFLFQCPVQRARGSASDSEGARPIAVKPAFVQSTLH